MQSKQQKIAEILGVSEEQVVNIALSYLLYLITMTASEPHNQWLKEKFNNDTNNSI